MSKIIIKNESCLDDRQALELVGQVILGGRISDNGNNYCFMTVFETQKGGIVVAAKNKRRNRK